MQLNQWFLYAEVCACKATVLTAFVEVALLAAVYDRIAPLLIFFPVGYGAGSVYTSDACIYLALFQ